MNTDLNIKILKEQEENGFSVFTLQVEKEQSRSEYQIYISISDLNRLKATTGHADPPMLAIQQMQSWISDLGGKLPKEKYRILLNGGKIVTDDIEAFFSIKKTSDLVRTNVTISAPLFEWAKQKAQKEDTSFSDLVSRGLLTLKDSDKEIGIWFEKQNSYIRNKLGDFGFLEIFHYLPNNYTEYNTDVIKDAMQQSEIRKTGWPIGIYHTNGDDRPHPQSDGIKVEYTPSDYLLLDYWYAKNRGEFYFARNLESDSGNGKAEPKTCLYFDTLIWRVAEGLEHCLSYYQALNINDRERIKVKISLYGLTNRFLSAWNPGRSFSLRHYTCDSDKSSWETEISMEELKKQLDDVIYEATKKILVMFDFFVPNKEVVLDVLNREYRKSSM